MSERRGRAEWERLVRRWRASGKSVKAFAEGHGVRAGTLQWWAWKLGQEQRESPMPFVPVEVSAPLAAPSETIDLEVAGMQVRVPVGADVAYVARLVDALRASA